MFFTTFLKERIGLIAFILATAYFLLLIRSDIIQENHLEKDRARLAGNIELESARQKEMINDLGALKKSSYVELLAREKLGLVQRGESAYKVIFK